MMGRRGKGQSIIETAVGIIFMIPIVLFLFDVAVLVMGNTANDNLAKSACRAAASATANVGGVPTGTKDAALTAAEKVVSCFASSNILQCKGLTNMCFDAVDAKGSWPSGAQDPPRPAAGQVGCITTMTVKAPVPFPCFEKFDFRAVDVEPIVSIAP